MKRKILFFSIISILVIAACTKGPDPEIILDSQDLEPIPNGRDIQITCLDNTFNLESIDVQHFQQQLITVSLICNLTSLQ